MSFIEVVTDSETLEKNRRALVSLSILIFLIAALDFRSDEIDLLGLKLGISQQKIVSIGQIGVAYLLLQYFSKGLGISLSTLHDYLFDLDSRWEEKTVASFPDFSDDPDWQPDPDFWEEDFAIKRKIREGRRFRVKTATECYSKISGLFSNIVFPFTLGLTSLVKTDALKLFLIYLGQK